MSEKALKSRINKFIFEDGRVFLRIKTHAKDLKVKKHDLNYEMTIPTHSDDKSFTSIPVIWINSFDKDKTVIKEATSLGIEEDDLKKAISSTDENWGTLTMFKDLRSDMNYYYLAPKNKAYAVKVGPIHKSLVDVKIEIDWSNLQWGGGEA